MKFNLKNMIVSFFRKGLFLLLFSFFGITQERESYYVQSEFVIFHQLNRAYTFNFGLSYRSEFLDHDGFSFESRIIELSHFSNIKIGVGKRFSFGLLYQFSEYFEPSGSDEFRLIQQYLLATKPQILRFSHRFRMEQRFMELSTALRVRYRFEIDFPLTGQTYDIGDYYFLGSIEPLGMIREGKMPRYDMRTSAGIGKLFNRNLKMQMRVQYRLENFDKANSHKLLLIINAYLKL